MFQPFFMSEKQVRQLEANGFFSFKKMFQMVEVWNT